MSRTNISDSAWMLLGFVNSSTWVVGGVLADKGWMLVVGAVWLAFALLVALKSDA